MRIVVCPKWFGVEPSVPDGGSELLSRSERTTPEWFCTAVSKLSKMLFENLIKFETRSAQRLSKVPESAVQNAGKDI